MSELFKSFAFDLQRFVDITIDPDNDDLDAYEITNLSNVGEYSATAAGHTANVLYWGTAGKISGDAKATVKITAVDLDTETGTKYYTVDASAIETVSDPKGEIVITPVKEDGSADTAVTYTFDSTGTGNSMTLKSYVPSAIELADSGTVTLPAATSLPETLAITGGATAGKVTSANDGTGECALTVDEKALKVIGGKLVYTKATGSDTTLEVTTTDDASTAATITSTGDAAIVSLDTGKVVKIGDGESAVTYTLSADDGAKFHAADGKINGVGLANGGSITGKSFTDWKIYNTAVAAEVSTDLNLSNLTAAVDDGDITIKATAADSATLEISGVKGTVVGSGTVVNSEGKSVITIAVKAASEITGFEFGSDGDGITDADLSKITAANLKSGGQAIGGAASIDFSGVSKGGTLSRISSTEFAALGAGITSTGSSTFTLVKASDGTSAQSGNSGFVFDTSGITGAILATGDAIKNANAAGLAAISLYEETTDEESGATTYTKVTNLPVDLTKVTGTNAMLARVSETDYSVTAVGEILKGFNITNTSGTAKVFFTLGDEPKVTGVYLGNGDTIETTGSGKFDDLILCDAEGNPLNENLPVTLSGTGKIEYADATGYKWSGFSTATVGDYEVTSSKKTAAVVFTKDQVTGVALAADDSVTGDLTSDFNLLKSDGTTFTAQPITFSGLTAAEEGSLKVTCKTVNVADEANNVYTLEGMTDAVADSTNKSYTVTNTSKSAVVTFSGTAVTGFKFGEDGDAIEGPIASLAVEPSNSTTAVTLTNADITLGASDNAKVAQVDKSQKPAWFILTGEKINEHVPLGDDYTITNTSKKSGVVFTSGGPIGFAFGANNDAIAATGDNFKKLTAFYNISETGELAKIDIEKIVNAVDTTEEVKLERLSDEEFSLKGTFDIDPTVAGFDVDANSGTAGLIFDAKGEITGFQFGTYDDTKDPDSITGTSKKKLSEINLYDSTGEINLKEGLVGSVNEATLTQTGYGIFTISNITNPQGTSSPITLGESGYSVVNASKKIGITFKADDGSVTGFTFGGDKDAITGDLATLATGGGLGYYATATATDPTAFTDKNIAFTALTGTATLTQSGAPASASFKLSGFETVTAEFGSTPTKVEATDGGKDSITFTAEGVLSGISVADTGTFTVSNDAKTVDFTLGGVAASATSKNTVDVTFSANDTVSGITIGKNVTAAELAFTGTKFVGTAFDIKKDTTSGSVNVNTGFKYTVTDGVHAIDLTDTNVTKPTGDSITVTEYGNATIINPLASINKINIAGTDYEYSSEQGSYFYKKDASSNMGFVFGTTAGDYITVKDGSALDLYDGDTATTSLLSKAAKVTGVDEYTVTKKTSGYSVTVGDGAKVVSGGTTVDFDITTANGKMTVTFDKEGKITDISPASGDFTAATEYSFTVDKAPTGGFKIGGTNNVYVESGVFTYGVDAEGASLTLTQKDDTVHSYGNATRVIPAESGKVTFSSTSNTVLGGNTFTVTTGGEARFNTPDASTGGFYFADVNDAIAFDAKTGMPSGLALTAVNGNDDPLPISFGSITNGGAFKITMTAEDVNAQAFEVSDLAKNAVYNDSSNTAAITFGAAGGGKLFLANNGTGTIGVKGVTVADTDTVKFAASTGTALLTTDATDTADWFQLNGSPVKITASEELTFDAAAKSLKGIADGNNIIGAGPIEKVYVGGTSGTVNFGNTEGTVGTDYYAYTYNAATADKVYFTVKSDATTGYATATGFVFNTTADSITQPEGGFPEGFKLYKDSTDTEGFSAPVVYETKGGDPKDAVVITKNNAKADSFTISGLAENNYVKFSTTELTFLQAGTTVAIEFSTAGELIGITGMTTAGDSVQVDGATKAINFGTTAKPQNVEITGGGFVYTFQTAGPEISEVKAGSTIVQTAGAKAVKTAVAPEANGEFKFTDSSFKLTGNVDGITFNIADGSAAAVAPAGITGINGTESVSGALSGLYFGTDTANTLGITAGDYTVFGGGLSLSGLKAGTEVTSTGGISNFITAEAGKFTILKTGMSIADSDGVTFKVAGGALAGIDSLKGSAIGDFAGGLSVNSIGVEVTGDSSLEVVGDDKTVTAINQLGVADAATAINVSASGVTNFGVNLNGKFDFNGAASFGVAGNGTEVTVFNLGTSAITGVDATETLSGNFENAFTVNGNALQVAGDSSISVVGGTQILGLTDGASVSKADNFTSATTDGLGTFKFAGGQSFTVSGTNKDGVVFQLDGKGKVVGISGVDEGEIVTGDLNGVVIKESGVAISVVGSDGSNNTNLTYQNGTLSGIVDGDTIYLADSATKVITAGGSVTFKAPDGDQAFWTDDTALTFDVKSDAKGVTATAVSELDAGKKLEGAIAGLSVNTKLVDITNDTDFGVIGAAAGVSAIYKLSDGAVIVDAAGATVASTDKFGTFTFQTSGQSFVTAGDSTVDFTLKDNAVTAINGLSGGSIIGNFDVLTGVNGQTFEVKNDSEIQVFAGADGKLSKIALVSGGASIGEIGSVSQILTDKAGEFVFTVGGQSFTTADDDTVTFGMSSSKVTSISELAGSVTGNFTGIKVNGATIDIIGDDEITVVGDGTKLTAIQGVDADATINAAGSVAQLVGNISASSGTFTFKDNGAFVIAGDSSVTFALDTAAAAKVTGISGIDGPATVTGGLSQVAFNGNSMSVAGDADNVFSYMVDAAGKATLGGVGGPAVTVNGVGGANFVEVTTEGDYNFFGTAYGLSLASGESSVLFGTDGKQVTSVADLEGTLKGDFSAAGFTVNGKEFEIAGDSSVGIVGSGSGVTKIVDLSGGANVKGVGGASVAITDSEGKFTFTNGSFSIAGDADGVTFMLEGNNVVGIKDLNEGATLTGSLDKLNSINGATIDIKDDNNFGVVGATSGISKVVDLSTPANVVNAGGASQALANTGETFTFPNGTFTISGDSAATFDLNTDSEVTNIGVKAGATVSGPLNGIAINGGASLNVLNDDEFGAVAGDSKLAQLINLSGGANVSEAGGASQFVTDQAGEFTILGTAMEIGGDDNVMFTAGTSGITAIDSLEGTAFGDFSNGIAVNSNDVKVLGDSSIEVTSDGSAVTAIASVTGSDAPTIAAVGGATEIGTDAAGTFTFTTGGASQAFTVGDDDEVTFALDADGVVTGVNALEDGTLGFKDVTDLTVNETALTIDSTQNVSLSIADSAVVYVQGVDGEISGLENATVAATTAMTVNSTDINVQGDDDYKVIVQDGAVVGLTDVSAGATVNVAGVSIAVNESGDFQIGGNTYTFTDENNAFTLTTGDDSQLSGVDELQGNVVIAAPSTQSLAVNGDGIAFASNADSVTVAAGASGITGVNGLVNKDGVSGDLTDAAIFMGGSSASVSTDGGALTVNEVTYTLLNDDNGITVTGGRVVTDLNENASLFVSEKGKYTVNGNTSDIEVEDTALPIIGLENASNAYIYDPAHILVGKNTPVREIEQMLGLTTEYPADPNFGTAENPLDTAGLSTALAQDLDKPLEIFATNDTKEPQDMNLAGTDFSKKVHLFDGPQSVEFNNFGANEAIIERENADGSATGGEKAITLGDGGDAVIMKADAGNGSAVDVTGGAGDDSVVVQGSAPVNFDMSQGGDDKIVTFAKSNARMTLEGYDALTNPNAGIHISERWKSLAAAIVSGLLSFGDGLLNINNTSGDSAKIAFAGHTDPIGAVLVNLFDYLGQKLAVAFTNSGGGLADYSAAVEPMLLIGNNDGNKSGGSTLLGGSGDDTAIAGGGDEIDLGLGNNEIVLDPSTTREGAGIGLTRGRTTIEGFNGTFNLDHGDVIATDLSSANISFDGTNVYIEGDGFYGVIAGAKPDGAISYDSALVESADSTDALTTTSGDYTNVLFNNAGVLVKTAIAKEGGVMDVKLDQDQRALNYIGDNSGLTFYDHTGEVFVNLADGTGSIDTADALFSGINSVAAGAGQTTIIGADDNETLIAGTGNDSIWGAGGNNLMRGNTGTNKTGQTSFFVVAEKDGARNTIEGFNFVTDDNYTNTNKITADKLDIQIQYDQIQTENGSVAISGNDVVLLVNNRNEAKAESVIIKDAVGQDFIVSGDGIIDDVIAQVNVDKLTADKFANYFVATGKNATLTVSNEFDKANIYLDNETPLGSDHEGEIPQFYGDIKVIDATGSNAKLELGGNDLDNTILAGMGDASLWGGNGGNDLLVGGSGKNSFFYNYGNGNDTIRGAKEGDVIDLTNILLDDIVDADSAIGDDGVKLQFTDGGSLTVEGTAGEYLIGDDTYVVEDGKWSKKA